MDGFFKYFESFKAENRIFDIIKEDRERNPINIRELDKPIAIESDKNKGCPLEGSGGTWSGERGDSKWIPKGEEIPGRYNPDDVSWKDILEKYGISSIEFEDGEPNFNEISKGNVEIDDFTDSRRKNFTQADEALAKEKGCSPEEVKKWREENGYTWHECKDRKTMQKVPSEVHNNIPHSGGISEAKKENQ